MSLAFVSDAFDWDLPTAEREFLSAIEANPGYAPAHHWYAWHSSVSGHNEDAIAELMGAQQLVLLRPGFDRLRSDPRFQALSRRAGLAR